MVEWFGLVLWIEKGGEKGSEISTQMARHDDIKDTIGNYSWGTK